MPRNASVRAAAGLLALCALVLPGAARAIEYGGFGGRPAFPRTDNPRTDSIFVHTLAPGTVQPEGIRVLNNTGSAKTLLVYAADSTPSTDGAFACKQLSEPKEGVGAWIALEKTEVTLEPSTNEVIPFTITVPANADVGEHNGCILIQEKKAPVEGQAGVNLSVRTGLRVAVMVPGDIVRKLTIAKFTVTPNEQGFLLHPEVRNDGNVSIDADVAVVTEYFFGRKLTQHGGTYPVLRGEPAEWNFQLPRPFFGGWYTTKLTVEYDADTGAGVGTRSDKAPVRLESATVRFFAWPTVMGLLTEIMALICLICGALLLWLWTARARWIREHWVTYEVGEEDDLMQLAAQHRISWKLLAKVNQLPPPYVVRPGQQLRLPPPPRGAVVEKKAAKSTSKK